MKVATAIRIFQIYYFGYFAFLLHSQYIYCGVFLMEISDLHYLSKYFLVNVEPLDEYLYSLSSDERWLETWCNGMDYPTVILPYKWRVWKYFELILSYNLKTLANKYI